MSARTLPRGEEPFKVEYDFHDRRYTVGRQVLCHLLKPEDRHTRGLPL